tara:strand:- start:7579 stop:9033 length:1455 start_codon:yes stop_codon:yes gene_type:complete
MSNPTKVGEGTYGCVHNPPLKCKDKPYNPDPNKVSKILTKKHANEELKEFKLIKKADKKENFHLGNPESCIPDDNIDNKISIDECKRFNSNNIKKYKLLLLKNGGKDLEQIEDKFKLLKENNQNRHKIENMWLDMSRILYGSKVLMDNGVIHKDLKQQNIVYNEETGRVNFIDFGLMLTTELMMDDAAKYTYNNRAHWSYPPEVVFYDHDTYSDVKQSTQKEKNSMIETLFQKYVKVYSIVEYYLFDSQDSSRKEFRNSLFISFRKTGLEITKTNYETFLTKSFETFDNYGIGFSLLSLLIRTKQFIDKRLLKDLKHLFRSMISFNIFERPSPTEVVIRYEDILKSHGLLEKYNMRFENHLLVEGSVKEEEMKETPKEEREIKKFMEELVIKCQDGKERNPKTKRCINNCKDGYIRNEEFKCKKDKTQKAKVAITKPLPKNKTQKKKECLEGKELNPKTNRCINKCRAGYVRDSEMKCKKMKNV